MTNLQQLVTVSLLKHCLVGQFIICPSTSVLVTKYRRKVITGNVLRRLQEICEDLCQTLPQGVLPVARFDVKSGIVSWSNLTGNQTIATY